MGGVNLGRLCWVVLLGVLHGVNSATVTNTGNRGAVASESKICSEIGAELIERGVSKVLSAVDSRVNLRLITWYREMLQMRWLVLLFVLG